MPQKNKSTQKKFRGRKVSIISKANELHRLCDAEVFFVARKNGKYYVYVAGVDPSWPPTLQQIVRLSLPYEVKTYNTLGRKLPSTRNKNASTLQSER